MTLWPMDGSSRKKNNSQVGQVSCGNNAAQNCSGSPP